MSHLSFLSTFCRQKLFLLLPFFSLIGCLTPIELPVEIAGGRLIVSGQISTVSDQNIINLSVTANTARIPFPVSNASITLFEDTGNTFSYFENELKPGQYILTGVTGTPGRSYHIEIILPNDKIYKSLPEKIPDAVKLDSTYYEIVNEDIVDSEGAVNSMPYIKIYTDANPSTSATGPYLKWGVDEVFLLSPTDFPDPFGSIPPPCFVVQNADPQRVVLFDGTSVSTSKIHGQLVGSKLIDWTFLERHYFTVYQSSITKDSYQYWRKVNILANQVGSIFDTPPAEITGNIVCVTSPEEKTLGYFQATNQSYKRFFLLPSFLPFPLLVKKCDFTGDFNPLSYPTRCIDCTSVPNSSYRRPDWF